MKWALLVVAGTFIFGFFLTFGVSVLPWLLSFFGLPVTEAIMGAGVLVTVGLGFGVALWVTERPSVPGMRARLVRVELTWLRHLEGAV